MPYSEKREYHPAIDDFVNRYAEDKLDPIEFAEFGEVLLHDDDLHRYADDSKTGKFLMETLRKKREEAGA